MPTPDTSFIKPSESARWVIAYADHVRRRFNSRVVVSLRRDGEAVRLRQIYAVEGGGLVLVEEDRHENQPERRHEHERGEHEHGEHERGEGGTAHGSEYECPRETWVASPDRVVLEVCMAVEGEWCTGFGYLGRSRTPHVLVPRGTEPPPKGHHH